MKLPITKLNEGENPFDFDSYRDGWLREVVHRVEKQGYRVEGKLSAKLNLTKLEPDYYLKGRLDFDVHQQCARCAEGFALPIHHSFDVALAHVSQVKIRGSELTEESEELDINFFEGHEIDLTPIIEEQFFLSIPYQAVCKTDCQGMCQSCGKNLNNGPCTCAQASKVNAFSVLQDYKLI